MYAHYEIVRFRHAELLATTERRRATRPTPRATRRVRFHRRPAA